MTTRITYEMLDELLFEDLDAPEPTRADFLQRAKTAEEWATDPRFELEEEELRPALLVSASRQATYADDNDRALELARQAVAAAQSIGDWLLPDVRTRLYESLRRSARDEEAGELEASLRRDLPQDLDSFDVMGVLLASFGDLAPAQRWFNMGIRFAEEHDLVDDLEYELLLVSRAEVREKAGLSKDDYDLEADDILDRFDEGE